MKIFVYLCNRHKGYISLLTDFSVGKILGLNQCSVFFYYLCAKQSQRSHSRKRWHSFKRQNKTEKKLKMKNFKIETIIAENSHNKRVLK